MSSNVAFAAGLGFLVALCAAVGAVASAMGDALGVQPWAGGASAGVLTCVVVLSVFVGED